MKVRLYNMAVMDSMTLVNKCKDLVEHHATVYAYGCWGNQLTESLINAKAKQYSWFYTDSKKAQLRAMTKLGYVVWAFDCVNMIKSILWGWCGNTSKATGGAVYCSNGVPDESANTIFQDYCYDKTNDFSNIIPGEFVWMNGHIGVYVGDNIVVECTPAWQNKVQYTGLGNRGGKAGYNTRTWTSHGKSQFIDYGSSSNFLPPRGWFQIGDSGDNVSKIDDFLASKVRGNYFGTYTKYAVMAFQHINGLEEDGCVGRITLGKMKEQGLDNSIIIHTRGWFQEGDCDDNVRKIDDFLADRVLGNYYGTYTSYCVKALQTISTQDGIYNDAIDGCFGSKTLACAEYYGFKY